MSDLLSLAKRYVEAHGKVSRHLHVLAWELQILLLEHQVLTNRSVLSEHETASSVLSSPWNRFARLITWRDCRAIYGPDVQ
jgi:hypothetical protein